MGTSITTGSGRQFAVVTGASSGIGRELAKLFVEHGYDLLVASEDAGIESAASEFRTTGGQAGGAHGSAASVDAVRVDLTTTEGVEQLAARAQGMGRPIDALALNAGVGLGGAFLEQPLDRILEIVHLNVRSTVHLARLLMPAMVARGQGKVLVTSSIAALMPGSFQAIYNASKAFEHSWAEAVRNEIKDSGVTVTALQPGPTDTAFFHRAAMDDTSVGAGKKDDPAQVAKEGFEAMLSGKDHVVAGSIKNRLQAVLSEVTPEPLKAEMHRKMAEPGSAKQ